MATVNRYSVVRHIKKRHPGLDNFTDYIVKFLAPNDGTVRPPVRTGYKCQICPFKTTKKDRLAVHINYHTARPDYKFKCRHCEYFVPHPRLLHAHIRLHLQQQGLLPSDNKGTDSGNDSNDGSQSSPMKKSNSSQNIKTLQRVPSKSGKPAFECTICPYFSYVKNDYLYHKQFHRPKPLAKYKCEHCPYWIKDRRSLTLHMKVNKLID
jgi:KRAB domain-containing zinc finger protein